MKKLFLLIILVLIATITIAQDDLDDVFNDGDKSSKFHLGTDVITFATGTPNINLDINFIKNMKWHGGFGVSPFGFLFDATDAFTSGKIPLIARSNYNSLFLTSGFKFYPMSSYDASKDLNVFYYLEFNRWSAKTDYLQYKNIKTKYNFGSGISYGLPGRLNLELAYGITFARLKQIEFYNNNTYDYNINNFIFGFNFGLGINYAL